MIDWPALEAANAPLNAFVDWDRADLGAPTIGIKSNIAVKGLPWTGGMARHQRRIASSDAAIVERFRASGAAILGSLNMHEAALGATTDNPAFGRTHNPHRIGHTPGGSSGGSGAAVAAGLCDFALGTDTLGSIRIPAAYCGIYGLKPTLGAVSNDGVTFLNPAFDCVGPMARSLDMLDHAWAMMGSAQEPLLSRLIRLADIGDAAAAVAAGYAKALAAIALPVETLSLTDTRKAIRIAGLVDSGRWLAADLGDMQGLSPELQAILGWCAKADPRPDIIARAKAELVAAIGMDGVLILPTTSQAAFPHGTPAPSDQADFTALASIAGLPALAMPAGLDDDRLPVSIQLVGPAHSEKALISLARSIEPALNGYQKPPHFLER